MKSSIFLAAICAAVLAPSATAQQTISTDRPGLGFNPALVGPAVVQGEFGLPAALHVGDSEVYAFPALLRVGITDWVEMRIGASIYDVTDGDGDIGFDAVEMGAKIALLDHGPQIALIPSLFIPTESGAALMALNGTAGWPLPNGFGLTTVAGVLVADDDATGTLVAVLGKALGDRIGGYVEAGYYPGPGSPDAAYAGAGLALLVAEDSQLDAYFDRGLSDTAADWLFGVGFSARLHRRVLP